ncbi:MAG TPA: hypothetical protein VHE79_03175 [Spirochaetia bacterium]
MQIVQSYRNNQLQIDVARDEGSIVLQFHGKSMLRDPNEFVMPILLKTLGEAIGENKRVVMDFRQLLYMNSSTLTPVIKILERARVGKGEITVSYRKALKWQDISFSALTIFQTPDQRITIEGSE